MTRKQLWIAAQFLFFTVAVVYFVLQIRSEWGDSTMWGAVALVSVIAGITGAAAVRGRRVVPREALASAA